ncbi:2,3-diketo-L-gulonate TRAP transporter, large permease protein [Escherichia coli]|uniref:2,3-diketo-L-gulonate TRAP transporter, large permease protein n=1 Tax=Escherichia coli TaxID=562 RepID=A0A376MKU1_ECOLX|nr:2,3-diketo-L-gulonate TRAP transporter, large permease protein [Escherichia coli]
MMRSANYPVNRAAGLIASGGIIGQLFPFHSFIIFGVSSGLSISKLFMAGIAPWMMMGATLMLTWWWQPVALIYPASKKQRCRKSGIFCLRYLGAVSSSHHYWAGFAPVCLPYRSRGRCCFLCAVCRTVIYREMTSPHFGMCSLAQRKRPQW